MPAYEGRLSHQDMRRVVRWMLQGFPVSPTPAPPKAAVQAPMVQPAPGNATIPSYGPSS